MRDRLGGPAGGGVVRAPFVAAAQGFLTAAVLFAGRELYGELSFTLAPVLALAALALVTRGRDWRALATITDRLGGPPAATVGLALLVQVSALALCVLLERGTVSVLLAVVTGALAVLWAAVPAAASRWVASLLTAVAVVAFAAGGAIDDRSGDAGATRAAVTLGTSLLVAWWLRRRAVRRLGAADGDVPGAVAQLTATVVLLLMAMGGK